MELDPEVEAVLKAMHANPGPAPGQVPMDEFRRAVAASSVPGMAPEMERVEIVVDGPVKARFYLPSPSPRALLVYFHGGGWTLGSALDVDAPVRRLAAGTRCAILSVDYRLAPENPFPAAVDDAYTALEWANGEGRERLGPALPPDLALPLVVAGESAGANLATVAAHLARDRQGPEIAAQALFCPCVTGRTDSPFMTSFDPPFLQMPMIEWLLDQYMPDGVDRSDPRFAPLESERFDLPPTFIATAQWDLLREQAETYAACLRDAATPTELHCYPGTFHGFLELDSGLAQSRQAIADFSTFLERTGIGEAG